MKRIPLLLGMIFVFLTIVPAVGLAAEKNVLLETPNIMPPIRQPMTKATIAVTVGSFEESGTVRLNKITLSAGGRQVVEKNIGKQLAPLNRTIDKGRFRAMLKGKSNPKSEQEAKDINAKLETQILQVDIKQAYPNLVPGDQIQITAVGDFSLAGQTFQVQSVYTATYEYPLPDDTEDGWYPGDGHVHTYYSNDNESVDPVYSPIWVATEGRSRGLRWLILTDHAQQLDFSAWAGNRASIDSAGNNIREVGENGTGENEWLSLKKYVNDNPLYFQPLPTGVGAEMSTVDPNPSSMWPYDSHYLAYDLDQYVENYPQEKLPKWQGKTESKSGQQMINDITANGGFGFLAHPQSTWYPWFKNWDYGAGPQTTDYTGMELISSRDWTYLDKWDELLVKDLPKTIETNEDNNFYSGRFVVGTSNSDGSGIPGPLADYGYLGTNLTYIQTEARPPSIDNVYRALKAGKVIATTGPLARLTINGYGIGSKQNVHRRPLCR